MSSYVIPFVYKSVFSFLVVVALVRVLNKILFKILLVVQLLQDDIIVKVNLQSPIPASFYITVAN